MRAFERKRYDVVLRYVPDAEREGIGQTGDEGAAPAQEAKPGEAKPGEAKPGEAKPGEAKPGEAKHAAKGEARTELTAEKLRAAWEGPQKEQINRIVQAIKTALPTAQIEETGDSAAMSYGAGGTVAFVREHGAWKIRDL